MNIKITALTPVHIGSGSLLQNNSEFFTVTVTKTGNQYVRVVDPQKILGLIGTEHVQDWVLSIERKQNIKEFVKVYAPKAIPADYSSRRMPLYCSIKPDDTLKECIHNGMGVPYIPGSSIKGALRTAVTASLANRMEDLDSHIHIRNTRNGDSVEAKELESYLFGADPNHDVFRFLQCGDAYFEKGSEIVLKMQTYLNLTHQDTLQETRKQSPQIIEAIGQDESCVFQMKLVNDEKILSGLGKKGMPEGMDSLSSLFKLVNEHTKNLIDYEIDFWENQTKSGAENYIEQLNGMRTQIENSEKEEGKSCVLRIGHSSGWNFITGGWSRKSEFFDTIVNIARPNNKQYAEYDFPKSRRLDTDGEMIGFVKLTIQDTAVK